MQRGLQDKDDKLRYLKEGTSKTQTLHITTFKNIHH